MKRVDIVSDVDCVGHMKLEENIASGVHEYKVGEPSTVNSD